MALGRSGLLWLEVAADMVVWTREVDSKPSIMSNSEPKGDMTLGIALSQLKLELPGSQSVGRVRVKSLPGWRRGDLPSMEQSCVQSAQPEPNELFMGLGILNSDPSIPKRPPLSNCGSSVLLLVLVGFEPWSGSTAGGGPDDTTSGSVTEKTP